MDLGRPVELGPAEALVADPAHPYAEALIAAVPEADPEITRAKRPLPLRSAEPPSLLHVPAGCPFHPRCPKFEAGPCGAVVPTPTGTSADPAAARPVPVPESPRD